MTLSKMRPTTLKTIVSGCIKKCLAPWSKQSLKRSVESTSTQEDYVYEQDLLQRLQDISTISERASEGQDHVKPKKVSYKEPVENIKGKVGPVLLGGEKTLSVAECEIKGGCSFEEAGVKVLEVGASLGISFSEVSVPSWWFTSWLVALSLSFRISEVPSNLPSLSQGANDDKSSQLHDSKSGFMGVCVLKEDSRQSPPIYSKGEASTIRKKNTEKKIRNLQKRKMIRAGPEEKLKKPAVVTATGGGSSTNQTSKDQQSGQETTKQSSTTACGTYSSPRSRNGGGATACGGTGGDEPPDDDRPRERSPPPDACGAGDEEQEEEDEASKEGAVTIPWNYSNMQQWQKFLGDDLGVNTGYYLRGAGNRVAGDRPAPTASPGIKFHGLEDGGFLSGLRSRKPNQHGNHPNLPCRFTASPPGAVTQTQPEVPRDQEIPERYKRLNQRESSGRGSGLSQVDREYNALMRENIKREALKQEDPLKMEELIILYHSLHDGREDHDPGGDDGNQEND